VCDESRLENEIRCFADSWCELARFGSVICASKWCNTPAEGGREGGRGGGREGGREGGRKIVEENPLCPDHGDNKKERFRVYGLWFRVSGFGLWLRDKHLCSDHRDDKKRRFTLQTLKHTELK
jgi:hypothetical protein